jgi:hypothetical protein
MIVQQDAVKNIFEALELNKICWAKTPLENIRELRNRSIGHPTITKSVSPKASHFISYPTLEKYSFQLMVCEKDKNRFPVVDIRKIIDVQRFELSKRLNEIIIKYEKDDKMHKIKYAGDKLEMIFSNIGYDISKLYEGVNSRYPIASINLKEIISILGNFENNLKEREENHVTVDDIYRRLEYPLRELEKYFNDKMDKVNDVTAYIFVFFIDKQIHELKDIAIEIDNKYSGKSKKDHRNSRHTYL